MNHKHFCTECGQTWSHEERTGEECRWASTNPIGPGLIELPCPGCQAKHPVLSDNEPWETPADLDEQMIRDFEAEGGFAADAYDEWQRNSHS